MHNEANYTGGSVERNQGDSGACREEKSFAMQLEVIRHKMDAWDYSF